MDKSIRKGHFSMQVSFQYIIDWCVLSHLAEAKVNTGSLADVHDLAVGAEHEDEPVQGLQQVGAQLLDNSQMQCRMISNRFNNIKTK